MSFGGPGAKFGVGAWGTCLTLFRRTFMASAAEARLAPVPNPLELPPDHVYFGPSPAMQVVRQRVDRSAGLNVPVLILGESGTGKEILARFIHERSPWRSGPFVKVNCPAIPGTLIESELFGFQKGAFTGAIAAKPGRMEMAQGGSLFLDEIAELDSNLQAKLLHVSAGWAFHPHRRSRRTPHGCARDLRDESSIAAGNRNRRISRRSFLPHQRDHHHPSFIARSPRRYSISG